MQDRCTFEYAIIRFVPKVEREEFFNVGVILFSKRKKFLKVKYHIDPNKLKAFSSEVTLEHLEEYLKSWELISIGTPSGGAIGKLELSDRFRWLTACRSTIIQSSKTHPGICNDPQKELDLLFKNYVL
ncbi:Protein of unknown function [Aquimarina amphilecti]|uniref:DUF3037 domain-containing protein n=1 Tax=Aquimarina amphilecti TaxID=1038014 RepID=A0A1H7Q1M0_AQUAM|nr:DUF3037 domain-containing protein [Aquimarina amphilecti]SEL42041.1 Protein of unknown function [Aquimarina amphilecti]